MKDQILDENFFEKDDLYFFEKGEEIIWEGNPIHQETYTSWVTIPESWVRIIARIRMVCFLGILLFATFGAYFWPNPDNNHLFIFSIKILGFIFLLLCIPIFIDNLQSVKTKYIFTSTRFIFEFTSSSKKIVRQIPLKEIRHVLIHKDMQGLKSGIISIRLKDDFDIKPNFRDDWGRELDRPTIGSIENVGEVFTLLQQYISKNKKA